MNCSTKSFTLHPLSCGLSLMSEPLLKGQSVQYVVILQSPHAWKRFRAATIVTVSLCTASFVTRTKASNDRSGIFI